MKRRITSRQNERFKAILTTLKGKTEEPVVLLEGVRLVEDALNSGVHAKTLLIEDTARANVWLQNQEIVPDEVLILAPHVYEKLSDTVTSQGVLLLASLPVHDLSALKLTTAKRILILDQLSDPGNVGTLLRSAEAFGFHDVVYVNGGVSPLSRKAARASMGSVMRVRIYLADDGLTVIEHVKKQAGHVFMLDMHGTSLTDFAQPPEPFALIVGNEAHGLSEVVKTAAIEKIAIPMQGHVESLNASVAASIVMYELGVN